MKTLEFEVLSVVIIFNCKVFYDNSGAMDLA